MFALAARGGIWAVAGRERPAHDFSLPGAGVNQRRRGRGALAYNEIPMKIKRSWLIASALWACLLVGVILYAYASTRVAVFFDVGFMLCVYVLTLVPWVSRRLRRARGLPYKSSWWGRFVVDCDYERAVRDKARSQGLAQETMVAAAKNPSAK